MNKYSYIHLAQGHINRVGQIYLFGLPLQLFWSARLGRVLPQHWRFPLASGSRPLTRVWVYCLAPEAPLIRGMPTGPMVFLAMPDACGQRVRTHLKNGLVPNPLIRWGAWQITGHINRVFSKNWTQYISKLSVIITDWCKVPKLVTKFNLVLALVLL